MKDQNPYFVGDQLTYGDGGLRGPKFDGSIRTMQIIAGALISGVLIFMGVVLVVTQGNIGGIPNARLMTMIAGGFGFLMIVNHFVIPRIVSGAQLKQLAISGILQQEEQVRVERMCAVYQTQLIIGMALLEGAAFFNLIAMMIEKSAVSLGVVSLLLGLMVVKFPTRIKVSWWIQERLRELQLR
jgi:hypothetical protein